MITISVCTKSDEFGNDDKYSLEEYKESFVQSPGFGSSSTTTPPIIVMSDTNNIENSNWAKKQLDYESQKQNFEHVVKISGKPFYFGGSVELNDISTTTFSSSMEVEPSPPPLPEIRESRKKKSVKDTVEEYSEGIINKTNQMSKEVTEKTIQYSNNILKGTLPLAKSIHESSLSSSEYISGKLFTPQPELVNSVYINSNSYDELVNSISSNMDEYSRNIIRDVEEKSYGVNKQTESIHKDTINDVDDYAKEALFIVSEKSTQLLFELDQVRSKVNTDVNIQFKELDIKPTIEMEHKLESLSTSTIDQMSNISDNIAKNILEI